MTKRDDAADSIARVDVDLTPMNSSMPALLEEMRVALSTLPNAGAKWVEGKAGQEYYKALEIKLGLLARVQEIEEARVSAQLTRDERRQKLELEARAANLTEYETTQRVAADAFASKAAALEKIATAVKTLREAGVVITPELLNEFGFPTGLTALVGEREPGEP